MSEFDSDTPRDEAGRFLGDHYRAEHSRLEFEPMPNDKRPEEDWPVYGSSDDEVRRAAREMQERRGVETETAEEVVWRDASGERLDPNISTSRDQAATALADYRQAKAEAAQAEADRALKAAVDAPRIELEITDPAASAKYENKYEMERAVQEFAAEMGVDASATQPTVEAAPEQQPARESTPGLDPDLARALEHPQVREMLEQQVAAYQGAIQEAGNYARSALIESFPELTNLQPQQYEAALQTLNAQNPERVARGLNVINRAVAIGQETARLNQEHQARSQAQRQQEIEKWSRSEGAKYDQWAAKEGLDLNTFAPAASKYIETHLGMSRSQFAEVLRDNPVLRAAGFQQVLSDAVRYRQAQEARKNIPRSLPPAPLRPGSQGAPAATTNYNAGKIAELTQALSRASGNKAVQIAAQITSLRRKG
jgi:hypothetical protein